MKIPRPTILALVLGLAMLVGRIGFAEVNKVQTMAPDVYFHEGDLKGHGHCNNGWIVFADYVLVIDGNFPSGAKEIIPKIRAITDKPIRFAFDTHHHGDHAYGNQVWVDQGATPVAHAGVIEEMKKYETGYYGDKPGRWEDAAKGRADVAASKLKPPSLLYRTEMIFDDGKHRVELLYFGVAHTHGDGFAWLPKEKILFTGDACVNGPYNYTGDGDTAQWIKTLEAAKKLGATCVAELPHLKVVWEAFGKDERFAMIGLSLDGKPDAPRRFAPDERREVDARLPGRLVENQRARRPRGGRHSGGVPDRARWQDRRERSARLGDQSGGPEGVEGRRQSAQGRGAGGLARSGCDQ
jgi:glyoxylase-like metal-dependent hydrolase (beta-lactamase superfamily II)